MNAEKQAFDLKIERFVPPSEPGGLAYYSVLDDIRGRRAVSTPFSDFCDPLVVTEHGTGHIKVFTKQGVLVGDLDTGRGAGALMGLAVSPSGELYVVDAKRNQLLRVRVG